MGAPYPNRDRAFAHVERRRDAYLRTLYRHFPQRLVLGIDTADTATHTRAFLDAQASGLLPRLDTASWGLPHPSR
ncbi:hypothetical protein [Streptomyces kebangsaanensis]|uniref:hypothetical protein n=1 Tax=Streptomyces kebangsaanensis TaxID=864058 RepID=UPI000B21E8A1|nr:hypothetical protein [Streptomyces kebangsaanensis]